MNIISKRIIASVSSCLISASALLGFSSSAVDFSFGYTTTCVPVSSSTAFSCRSKTSDSSIYVYNTSRSTKMKMKVYGNTSGYTWNQGQVYKCKKYWEQLNTQNLLLDTDEAYLVRNYVNENSYTYAVVAFSKENTNAYDFNAYWQADVPSWLITTGGTIN